jgi:cysteine desulfurase
LGSLTHGNVRVSLSRDSGQDDVDRLLAALPDVVAGIRKGAGL